jgi:predicted restriction endonuclease
MKDNGGFAPLGILYEQISKYRVITGETPNNTIQERVQRDPRFTRVGKGVYALTSFIKNIDKEDVGNFEYIGGELIFKKRDSTERLSETKIRIGQTKFKADLMSEMQFCPITGINEKKLLIASHIKPWSHSDNEERLNPKNGLLLSPLFDKLFDKDIGLITFTLNKEILISRFLSKDNARRLNVSNGQVFESLPIDGRESFLEYHRRYIFQG